MAVCFRPGVGQPVTRAAGRRGGENTEFISERIVNISEIEGLIREAYCGVTALRAEMEKKNPSMVKIDEFSKQIHLALLQAKDFEFCLEQRRAVK